MFPNIQSEPTLAQLEASCSWDQPLAIHKTLHFPICHSSCYHCANTRCWNQSTLPSQHTGSPPEHPASASERGGGHPCALPLCRWLVTRVRATGTGARERLPGSFMYQCSQSVTKKSSLISSKCKFMLQYYNSLEKKINKLEIGMWKMVANNSPRRHGHRKRQTWKLLFLQKPWTANSLHSSTDTMWFPMGVGVALAKPQLLRHLLKKKDVLKVFSVSSHLITLPKSHGHSLSFSWLPVFPRLY